MRDLDLGVVEVLRVAGDRDVETMSDQRSERRIARRRERANAGKAPLVESRERRRDDDDGKQIQRSS
jgi:hypothetical protein